MMLKVFLVNGYIKIKGSIEEQSVKIVNDILDDI